MRGWASAAVRFLRNARPHDLLLRRAARSAAYLGFPPVGRALADCGPAAAAAFRLFGGRRALRTPPPRAACRHATVSAAVGTDCAAEDVFRPAARVPAILALLFSAARLSTGRGPGRPPSQERFRLLSMLRFAF